MYRYRLVFQNSAGPLSEEKFRNKLAAFAAAFEEIRNGALRLEEEIASVVVIKEPTEVNPYRP